MALLRSKWAGRQRQAAGRGWKRGTESVPPQHLLAGLAHSVCTAGGGLGPRRSAIHAPCPPPELRVVLEVVLDRFTLL